MCKHHLKGVEISEVLTKHQAFLFHRHLVRDSFENARCGQDSHFRIWLSSDITLRRIEDNRWNLSITSMEVNSLEFYTRDTSRVLYDVVDVL